MERYGLTYSALFCDFHYAHLGFIVIGTPQIVLNYIRYLMLYIQNPFISQ